MAACNEVRKYSASESAVFFKTKEKNGGLSNMCSGYPLFVASVPIRSSEALYQAMRYTHLPNIQRDIISERSPMTAKMISKKHRSLTRDDWMSIRVIVMKWCLRVKLVQNFERFSEDLLQTGEKPIVEKKVRREDFWGAKIQEDGTFVGRNVLGRLLMELREKVRQGEYRIDTVVHPPPIHEFNLFGRPVGTVCRRDSGVSRLI